MYMSLNAYVLDLLNCFQKTLRNIEFRHWRKSRPANCLLNESIMSNLVLQKDLGFTISTLKRWKYDTYSWIQNIKTVEKPLSIFRTVLTILNFLLAIPGHALLCLIQVKCKREAIAFFNVLFANAWGHKIFFIAPLSV